MQAFALQAFFYQNMRKVMRLIGVIFAKVKTLPIWKRKT
jgi:hypothetical protein